MAAPYGGVPNPEEDWQILQISMIQKCSIVSKVLHLTGCTSLTLDLGLMLKLTGLTAVDMNTQETNKR